MKLRLAVYLLALVCFSAGVSLAQEMPKLELSINYSHLGVTPTSGGLGSFSLNGGSGQVAFNFTHWISGVADVGFYTMGRQQSNTIGLYLHGKEISYLFGPRLTYRHLGRLIPFGQVLGGMFHANADAFATDKSETKLAFSAGAGIDVRVKSYLAIRPFAIDYIRTQFAEEGAGRQIQSNLRYSGGLVFRY